MDYPPTSPRPDAVYSYERLKEIFEVSGGIASILSRAAYFAFDEDFQGFVEESLEVFDNLYMPYFSENTISEKQYLAKQQEYRIALMDIWLDITSTISSYVGSICITRTTTVNSCTIPNKLTIIAK